MAGLGAQELIGILVAILVIWVVLKLARMAIRLGLFIIGLMLIIWMFYDVFMR